MISQFFVVSMRGDTILHKDCKLSKPTSFEDNGLSSLPNYNLLIMCD